MTKAPAATRRSRALAEPAPQKKNRAPYYLILGAVIILCVGLGYPVLWQVVTSFQGFGLAQQLGTAPPEFVWFENYIQIATSPAFWGVAIRSILFCIITATITVFLGLLIAVLMMRVPSAVRLTLQIALLLAWAMPVVAAMTVWAWLFDRRRGVINYLLSFLPGVEMEGYNWTGGAPIVFFSVASIIIIWMSVPFVAFSSYAGLTQISDEVLEASQLDGATVSQRLRYIIIPMIRPVIMIVLLLNLIWDLRVFAQIKLLQDSPSGAKTSDYDLLGTYIYKNGVGSFDFGGGAAMSIFVLALTIALSWFYVRSLLKEDKA